MGKIIYREFLGSRLVLWFLFVSAIGIPLAVVYILERTVTVEESVNAPADYVAAHREKQRRSRWLWLTT